MLVRTLPKTAVYQGQVNKGRILPRHCYKERKEGVIDAIDELGNGFSIEVCI